MARSLREMHFVCHEGRNVIEENGDTFLTGWWVVNPDHVQPGQIVGLHENRSTPSYRQGVVLALVNVREQPTERGRRQRRVQLRVQHTPGRIPWSGNGSSEKGFVWA
jgi:hypothetical protein